MTTALLAAGYGVMFTVLDDFRDKYSISESSLGLVVAIGFFTSFIGQVTLAPLADRGHARSLMVWGMSIVVGGTVLMAMGKTLPALLVARFIMGFGTGMAVPAIRRVIVLLDMGQGHARSSLQGIIAFARQRPTVNLVTHHRIRQPQRFNRAGKRQHGELIH